MLISSQHTSNGLAISDLFYSHLLFMNAYILKVAMVFLWTFLQTITKFSVTRYFFSTRSIAVGLSGFLAHLSRRLIGEFIG